jgi:hypothetical protein
VKNWVHGSGFSSILSVEDNVRVTKDNRRGWIVVRRSKVVACFIITFGILICVSANLTRSAYAASQADFRNTNHEIESAYVSVENAEKDGGNVTSLIAQLNNALQLVQNAEQENESNPSQAESLLSTAFQDAQNVTAHSSSVALAGISSRQVYEIGSIGIESTIATAALVVYFFGARIYRMIWFRLYRGYTARRTE